MDHDATWWRGRPARPRPHCVRWGFSGDPALPHFSAHVYCGQTVAHLSNCWALVQFHIRCKLKDRSICSMVYCERCPHGVVQSRTSIASNFFDWLWDFSTTFRRRRNLFFQFRLQIFRRRVVTKLHQNRSTLKSRSAGQRQTHRQTNSVENNGPSGLQSGQ